MKTKNRLSVFIMTIAAMALGMSSAIAKSRPNIIFLLSDDQRFDSLGMTGHPVTETPNLDRLAEEGGGFKNAFVTSPICGPSRANIFTGQWERKNRIGFSSISKNYVSQQAFDNSFLMQLKQVGYSTAFIGKHHTKIVDRRSYRKASVACNGKNCST